MTFDTIAWDGLPSEYTGNINTIEVAADTTILASQLKARTLIKIDNSANAVVVKIPDPADIEGKAIVFENDKNTDPVTFAATITKLDDTVIYDFVNPDENIEIIAENADYTVCH